MKTLKNWKQYNENLTDAKVTDVTNEIRQDDLSMFDDEVDEVGVGDIVIATYWEGAFKSVIFEVENLCNSTHAHTLECLGTKEGGLVYTLSDAFHVVKKETYDKGFKKLPDPTI